ncbi:hypothetical protein [Paenibacillus sabinae]|uniref:Holin n=1 Tax=Paenibacillus sabinae T27 TaxID=1268072 RepID=X4ZR78_9BACL|nr:hypothetical protein [Paenibacillus sabinae]AHV98970.1 hypothetical protein PSAB_20395 [Paenibacillus sabinae T27]
MKKRLLNPVFIAAVAGLTYQLLVKYGAAPEAGVYQAAVDIVTYAVIGVGIYKTFPAEDAK